jgi:hypothetical protein
MGKARRRPLDVVRHLLDELRADAVALQQAPETNATGQRLLERVEALSEAIQEREIAAFELRR